MRLDAVHVTNSRCVDDSAVAWLGLLDRGSNSLWANSPHVTSHVVRGLDAVIASDLPTHQTRTACKIAVAKAVESLLPSDVLKQWEQFRSYKQIDVLFTLSWLSRAGIVEGLPFNTVDIRGTLFVQKRSFGD
jgi:hypothetical protein